MRFQYSEASAIILFSYSFLNCISLLNKWFVKLKEKNKIKDFLWSNLGIAWFTISYSLTAWLKKTTWKCIKNVFILLWTSLQILFLYFFHFSKSLDNVLKWIYRYIYWSWFVAVLIGVFVVVIFSTRISITPNTLHWQRLYSPSSWCWCPFFYWTCWLPWWVTLIKWSLPNQKRNGENRLVLFACKL